MKKIYKIFAGLSCLVVLLTSGVKSVNSNNGITGQTTLGCTCHGSQTGTITVTNLPTQVAKGTQYSFNLTYAPGASYKYFGLDVKATAGTLAAGTGMKLSGGEVTHSSPLGGTATTSYTYAAIKWTAPATNQTVTFNYACVAGASTGTTAGPWQKGSTTTSVVLPVELISFSAAKNGSNKVNISWQTAVEINAHHFEVEKSVDGKTFTSFATVAATGNSSIVNKYTATDNLDNSNAVVYYRLKSVDKDGSYGYSSIQSINIKSSTNLVSVYPNPAKKGQTINVELNSNKTQQVSFMLINNEGKIVSEKVKEVVVGYNRIGLQFSNFIATGKYFLQVKTADALISPTQIIITE